MLQLNREVINVEMKGEEMTREEAIKLLMAELEKGERSGREGGYIPLEDAMRMLGRDLDAISDDDEELSDEHNNHTTKSDICQ